MSRQKLEKTSQDLPMGFRRTKALPTHFKLASPEPWGENFCLPTLNSPHSHHPISKPKASSPQSPKSTERVSSSQRFWEMVYRSGGKDPLHKNHRWSLIKMKIPGFCPGELQFYRTSWGTYTLKGSWWPGELQFYRTSWGDYTLKGSWWPGELQFYRTSWGTYTLKGSCDVASPFESQQHKLQPALTAVAFPSSYMETACIRRETDKIFCCP